MRLSVLIPGDQPDGVVMGLRDRLTDHDLGGYAVEVASDRRAATGDACLLVANPSEADPDQWCGLLQALSAGAQVVYGSRLLGRQRPPGMAWSCYVGHRLRTAAANQLYDLGLSDEATGVIALDTAVLRSTGLTPWEPGFHERLASALASCGVTIAEVPVRYCPRPPDAQAGLRQGVQATWQLLRQRLQ